jgi:hypothetical protein
MAENIWASILVLRKTGDSKIGTNQKSRFEQYYTSGKKYRMTLRIMKENKYSIN